MDQPVPWLPDLAAQQIAREKIIAYMSSHERGVPWLQTEIEKRLPRKQTISRSTLQRFLRGKKVNDRDTVIYCTFSASLPFHDPIAQIGKALAAIYAGDLNIFHWFEGDGLELTVKHSDPINHWRHVAELVRDDGFFRVAEMEGQKSGVYSLELAKGVMVVSDVVGIVVLQTVSTKSARTYMIAAPVPDYPGAPDGPSKAEGFGTAEVFDPTGEIRAVDRFAVELAKGYMARMPMAHARADDYDDVVIYREMPDILQVGLQNNLQEEIIEFDDYTKIVDFMARAFKRLPAKKGHAVQDRQNQPRTPLTLLEKQFLKAAADGSYSQIYALKEQDVNVNVADERTGLTALHLLAGGDNQAAWSLIAWGAEAVPDRWGRLPSVVALECGASAEMCDLLTAHEMKNGPV